MFYSSRLKIAPAVFVFVGAQFIARMIVKAFVIRLNPSAV